MSVNAQGVFDLTARVAVITGGSRGLGFGIARAFSSAGATVVTVSRNQAAGTEAIKSLLRTGREATHIEADVTRPGDVQRVLDTAIRQFGGVDILVNNAGACVHGPALEVAEDDWRRVMDVNLDAVWSCSRVFGRHFVAKKSGVIVNIGSISGIIVNRPQWQPAYNASKAAVHQLTKSLAAEWAPHGVRVNALAPGYIKTEMAPVDDPRFRRHWIDDTPMRRYATVEEIAPAALFLASDAASFITGSVLVADGGYTTF